MQQICKPVKATFQLGCRWCGFVSGVRKSKGVFSLRPEVIMMIWSRKYEQNHSSQPKEHLKLVELQSLVAKCCMKILFDERYCLDQNLVRMVMYTVQYCTYVCWSCLAWFKFL